MSVPSRNINRDITRSLTPERLDNKLATVSLEPVSKVEFIIRADTITCNVCINDAMMNQGRMGVWRTRIFPATITPMQFMTAGNMEYMNEWKEGRIDA